MAGITDAKPEKDDASMYAKPFIGISVGSNFDGCASDRLYDPLLPRWLDCISRAGGVPVIVPRLEDETDLRRVLEHLQGLVLAGRQDMALPATRCDCGGHGRHPESALIRLAADLRLPFLGIGIGLQALNVALGGSLLELVGETETAYHVFPHNPRHMLLTRPGSLVNRVYGQSSGLVNSPHQLAVDEIADGFVATACCRDGIVEAIESETKDWFAVGVQFSPEADVVAERDLQIFEEFIDEVVARSAPASESDRPVGLPLRS